MTKLGYSAVMVDDSITVTIKGKSHVVDASAPNFAGLWAAIGQRASLAVIEKLMSVRQYVETVTSEIFDFHPDGSIYYNGKPAPEYASRVLADALSKSQDIRPLCRFFKKVFDNPQDGMVSEIFDYFQNQGCKITPDGDILAIKIVRNDYLDHHSGTVSYALDRTVSMERAHCDTNRGRDCSSGLHFCGPGYVHGFGGHDSRVMFVQINPADVTSIPNYAGFSKARCCSMRVVGECSERRGRGIASAWERHLGDFLDTLYAQYVDETAPSITIEKAVAPAEPIIAVDDPILVAGKLKLSLSFVRAEIARLGSQRRFVAEHNVPRATLYSFLKRHEHVPTQERSQPAVPASPEPVPVPTPSEPVSAPTPPEPAGVISSDRDAPTKAPTKKMTQGAGVRQPDTTRKMSSAERAMAQKAAANVSSAKSTIERDLEPDARGTFSHGGKTYSSAYVTKQVQKLGQRGFHAESGIPRSTLQKWLKIIAEKPAVQASEQPPNPESATSRNRSAGEVFTYADDRWTAKEVKKGVEVLGQRGFSLKTGVPRSTLQNWLRRIG